MNWMSTTTGCFAVSNAVAKTTLDLGRFVRDVRESRADLLALSAELHALDGVLDLLKDDAASASFPVDMALQTPAVVHGSGAVIIRLDAFFSEADRLAAADKRAHWLAMRHSLECSRAALEVYRLTLGLALDLVACIADSSKASKTSKPSESETKDVARILAEMGHLRGRVRGDLVDNDAASKLQDYLNVLQTHARAVHKEDKKEKEKEKEKEPGLPSIKHDGALDSPVGKSPDSAVDLNIDLDMDDIPSRAPTPPPKAAARGSSALGFHDRPSSNGSANARVSDVPMPTPTPTPTLKPNSDASRELRECPSPSSFPAITTANCLVSAASTSQPRHTPSNSNLSASATLSIRSGDGASSILSGSGGDGASARSNSSSMFTRFLRTMRSTTSGFSGSQSQSQNHNHNHNAIQRPATSTSNYTPTTTASDGGARRENGACLAPPAAPSPNTSHVRRYSASLGTPWTAAVATSSVTTTVTSDAAVPKKSSSASVVAGFFFSSSSASSSSASKKNRDKEEARLASEPDAVFGVSLRKSINIASSVARTHHSGGSKTSDTKGGSSRREFPLCIFKCYTFIRQDDGLHTPDIFGGGIPNVVDDDTLDIVNWRRVQALRDIFSRAPDYGQSLDLAAAGYSRHDAAALILQYLEALPRPLVPDTVARHWITLSRQATVAGSYAKRLDQCIDFWEEALGGVRGPARSLLKLLLNLWGEVADAADYNDMTAERLASRVMNPLFQFGKASDHKNGRYETDYMLSLAFIIRKRSEYSLLLRGGSRKSNAAFEA